MNDEAAIEEMEPSPAEVYYMKQSEEDKPGVLGAMSIGLSELPWTRGEELWLRTLCTATRKSQLVTESRRRHELYHLPSLKPTFMWSQSQLKTWLQDHPIQDEASIRFVRTRVKAFVLSPSLLSTDKCFADEWTRLSTTIPNGGGREIVASVQLNNVLYFVAGGWENKRRLTAVNTVTSYNCTTDTWMEHPPLPVAKGGFAAAVLNQHEFVVVGGYTGCKNKHRSTYLYNTKTKSWTSLPDLKRGREWPACVCVDEKIYAMGGYNDDNDKHEDSIEMLDLSVSQPLWTILPARLKQGCTGCVAVADNDGDIIVTGGHNGHGIDLNSVEVFDTHNQVWKPTRPLLPPMLTGRSHHCLISLKSGRVLVALGGWTNTGDSSISVEFLMMENNGNPLRWIPMPSMEVGRCGFAAFATTTTTQPGILVAGGNRHWTSMEFLQEPSKQDFVYWTLLNPPPLEKPSLATEPPMADTTIHQPAQSIQHLERQRNDYQVKVLRTMVSIRQSVENLPSTPTTTRAIQPEERIKRLREVLDNFLHSVNSEIKLIRQSAGEEGLRGVVLASKSQDASSISSLSTQSEETFRRPDLAAGAQRAATRTQQPYAALNQRHNAWNKPARFVEGRPKGRKVTQAMQQEEDQDGKKPEAEDVETPQSEKGGNPYVFNEDRLRSNPPSLLRQSPHGDLR